MVRAILACAAVLAAGEVRGTELTFGLRDQATLDEFLAADIQPGDSVRLVVGGYLTDVTGRFADGNAQVGGFFWEAPPRPIPGIRFDVPLGSDVSWWVYTQWQVGVLRGGDHQVGGNEQLGTVDLQELNAVRNDFGKPEPIGSGADVTYDNRVDINDLNMVRNRFGEFGYWQWIAPDGPFCNSHNGQECQQAATATPEPAALALLATALFGLSTLRGRVPR